MARQRKRRGSEANFRCLYRSYLTSARKRSLSFSLTPERFRELTKLPCFICGQRPATKYRHERRKRAYQTPYVYNGIDRMDNRKGYVDGNCAPCCPTCNYAKGSQSLNKFLLYIYKAYKHAIEPAL